MDNVNKFREILDKSGEVVIVVGQNYSMDEMASALSFHLALRSSGKTSTVISSKEPLVEVSNLVGIDKVKKSYEGSGGDLIVQFPYEEGEIEKISYTLEEGSLNIVVKPSGDSLSFGENEVRFKKSGGTPTLVITFGVKRLSELQTFFDVESLKETSIVNIDKDGNEKFGELVFVSDNSSSVSEQTASILSSLGYPFDTDIAQNLLSGIVSSTNNFQNPRTSSLAFEMAGVLIRNGAKRIARLETRPQGQFNPQKRTNFPEQNYRRDQRQDHRNDQRQENRPREDNQPDKNPPEEWLAPKIYKGSTNV